MMMPPDGSVLSAPAPFSTPVPAPFTAPMQAALPEVSAVVVVAHEPPVPLSRVSTRRQRPPQATHRLNRPRVLDATAQCLDELGYDKTTIRTIALRLDCAVGSIYRYSRDKRELLDAVVQRRFEPVIEAAEQERPIDQTTRQYIATASAQPEQYRLMFWLAAVRNELPQPAPLPAIVDRLITAWTRQLGTKADAERHWALAHSAILLNRAESLSHAQADADKLHAA